MRTAKVRSSTAQTIALGSAAVLLVTLGSIACSDQATAPPTAVHSTAELAAVRTVTPDQQARIDRAMEQMRWVGEAHDEGMAVARRHIMASRTGRGRPAKLDARAKCRAMEEASDVALTVIDRATGRNRSRAERALQIRSAPELQRCTALLSVSSAATGITSAPEAASSDEVTGAYEPYAEQMNNAVLASGGSVAGVQAAVNSVMAQAAAAGIPDADLQAVAAIGNLALASAIEWNAFDWTAVGGDGRGDCTLSASCDPLAMSMFSAASDGLGRRIARVVGADVGGCFSTVRNWGALRILLGTAAPQALAGACGFLGAAASIAVLYAMI
jgi:hypothetical protein